MSEVRSIVEGLTGTVGGQCAHIAGLVEVERSQDGHIITAAITESE